MQEVGRIQDKRRKPQRKAEWFPAYQVLHFFYTITNERGTKTVFTYAHVKWFYGQSEHAHYLNYFITVTNGIISSSRLSLNVRFYTNN